MNCGALGWIFQEGLDEFFVRFVGFRDAVVVVDKSETERSLIGVDQENFARFLAESGEIPFFLHGLSHEFTGGVDDLVVAAVVGGNVEQAGANREIMIEIFEEIDVGAGEAVDSLPIVADGEKFDGGSGGADGLHGGEEKLGEILVFVNEEVFF